MNPSPRLDSRLVRGLSKDEAAELELRWNNCKLIREELIKVLTNEIESVTLQEEGQSLYDCPNALAKIAFLRGQRESLRSASKLLT